MDQTFRLALGTESTPDTIIRLKKRELGRFRHHDPQIGVQSRTAGTCSHMAFSFHDLSRGHVTVDLQRNQ